MSSIQMIMRSAQDWRSIEMVQKFVDILVLENDFLLPQKFDYREPERFVFDAGDLTKFFEIWTSEMGWLFLKRRKPYLTWIILRQWVQEAKRLNEITAGFDERYFKKDDAVTKLLSCAKRLYDWGAIVHGYICHEEDWNTKNYFGSPTIVAGNKLTSTGGLRLEDGLPGIYWVNFFGPIYVEFFGREKFLTIPAYHKEELPDGGFLLLSSPSPLDYDRPQVIELEQQIIDHLGREAFFEKQSPQKQCEAPQFTFEQAALGQPIEVVADDPISRIITDPHSFIIDASAIAQALVNQLKAKLDFSPESLSEIESLILKKSYRHSETWVKEKSRRLVQELTAYYGEVLRRNLGGKWNILEGSAGIPHPVVVFTVNGEEHVEYPFTRVYKLWLERNRAGDGLAARYYLLKSGQLKDLAQYLKKLKS